MALNKRQFLKLSGGSLAGAVLAPLALSANAAAPDATTSSMASSSVLKNITQNAKPITVDERKARTLKRKN